MIQFHEFTLDNGLRVVVHPDHSTPMAVVNVLYNVGSRDEDENRTGFAHLFEHLMFGGSANVPSYDEAAQRVGGEVNAFTSPDITNYYVQLPAQNLETAFWLESDRMMALSFDHKVLEVQRKVVIEEFKQRYLNQPYGDVWLKLRPLAYQVHPYRWATIGKDISHIEGATMDDVQAFFYRFYRPNNAILVVTGNVHLEEVKRLAQKWFGPLSPGEPYVRNLPVEPVQTARRDQHVEANVPVPAIWKVYHNAGRLSPEYHSQLLMNHWMGGDHSSILYQRLVKQNPLFNQLESYSPSSMDPGLLVIEGRLNPGVSFETAEAAIDEIVAEVKASLPTERELTKLKNSVEAGSTFGKVELLHRTITLANYALMGDANLINTEDERYMAVTAEDLQRQANSVLQDQNCSVLYYHATPQA